MALTRKFLAAMGIEDAKIEQIIDAHRETVDALKDERDKYKADAEKLPDVTKERDGLKAAADKADKDPYKVKYDALKEEFEEYKTEQKNRETAAKKTGLVRDLLKEIGISDKRIDAVMRVTDMKGIELDDKGKITNESELKKQLKDEWADFIVSTEKKGANVPNPPKNDGNTLKSREEIYKKDDSGRFILDATQRQAELSKLIVAEQQKG